MLKYNQKKSSKVSPAKAGLLENKILIVSLATVVLIGIVLFIIFFRPTTETVAGQAVKLGTPVPVANVNAGDFGLKISEISGAAAGSGFVADIIPVTVFVSFPGGSLPGSFRIKLNYDATILEPVSTNPSAASFLTNHLSSFKTNLLSEFGQGYYLFSFGKSVSEPVTLSGYTDVFTAKFKVIASEPPQNGDPGTYVSAVFLEPATVGVTLDTVSTSFGIFKTSINPDEIVQLVNPSPSTLPLTLTVYPHCQDQDGDDYGAEATDIRGCKYASFDCDDNPSDDTTQYTLSQINSIDTDNDGNVAEHINPEGTEDCNGVNENCIGDADENLNAPLNNPPQGLEQLAGVCFGYKTCGGDEGWINSYESDSNYKDETCDFYDNDCDGDLNEGFPGCAIGGDSGPAIVADLVGNTYIDPFDSEFIDGAVISSETQILTDTDKQLLAQMITAYKFGNCGHAGELLCGVDPSLDIDNAPLWICLDGVYYIDYEAFGFGLIKFSPTENLVVLTGADRTTAIADLISGVISCASE